MGSAQRTLLQALQGRREELRLPTTASHCSNEKNTQDHTMRKPGPKLNLPDPQIQPLSISRTEKVVQDSEFYIQPVACSVKSFLYSCCFTISPVLVEDGLIPGEPSRDTWLYQRRAAEREYMSSLQYSFHSGKNNLKYSVRVCVLHILHVLYIRIHIYICVHCIHILCA